MKVNTFFNLLFPGDESLGVPAFSICDKEYIVNGFFDSIPEFFVNKLNDLEDIGQSPDEILTALKASNAGVRLVVDMALSFYFSRPNVIVPLTGRSIPLTISGMAKY